MTGAKLLFDYILLYTTHKLTFSVSGRIPWISIQNQLKFGSIEIYRKQNEKKKNVSTIGHIKWVFFFQIEKKCIFCSRIWFSSAQIQLRIDQFALAISIYNVAAIMSNLISELLLDSSWIAIMTDINHANFT